MKDLERIISDNIKAQANYDAKVRAAAIERAAREADDWLKPEKLRTAILGA